MRTCDGCTACCSGALRLKVEDTEVWRGNPCKYICNSGCSIYESDKKPEVCSRYQCLWLVEETLPEWMKPSNSGVIIDIMGDIGNADLRVVCTTGNIESHVFGYILFLSNRLKLPLSLRYVNSPDLERPLVMNIHLNYFNATEFTEEMEQLGL